MAYKLILPPEIEDRIASWGLPHKLLVEVYQRLQNMAGDPDRHLDQRVAPTMAFAFRFIAMSDRIPHQHYFFFAVDRDDEQQRLAVVGATHSTECLGLN